MQLLESEVLAVASLVMVISGFSAASALCMGVRAPYGRYVTNGGNSWSLGLPLVPATAAWVLQECPSFIAAFYCTSSHFASPSPFMNGSLTTNVFLITLYLGHYFYRAFVFPFRIVGGKPTPSGIMAMAFIFCVFNGWLQSRWLAAHADFGSATSFVMSPRVIVGVCVWATGLFINLDADATLRSLRKPGETGYKIPYGGAFALVSGANFFGEIVEWTGFAIAASAATGPDLTGSTIPWLAALARTPGVSYFLNPPIAFAIFTLCNIGPRGAQHHASYLEIFGKDYPRNRAAVIPFIW
jgi:3-oxo-5-alpha-steroid 4-dehydrogenase 1